MKNSSVDQIILSTLGKVDHHLTSQQIFIELKTHLPAINPSTVYRSLERLVKNGKVSISDLGTGASVFELITEGVHHHLVCQNCHQTITINNEEVQEFFNTIEFSQHFLVQTHHLILFGLCSECQNKNRKTM